MNAQAESRDTLHATLATTFDVLAWEIELAGARCLHLDSIMSNMMVYLPKDKQADFLESMHTVDLLTQQLTGLSAFTRRMINSVPTEISASVSSALSDITLAALADRMQTAFGGEEKGINSREGSGDVDLF